MRQCISCREQFTRDNLIRITKEKDKNVNLEKIYLNPTRYQLGRSIYICKSKECLTKAIKDKKITKLLRTQAKNVEPIIGELESLVKTFTQHSVKAALV